MSIKVGASMILAHRSGLLTGCKVLKVDGEKLGIQDDARIGWLWCAWRAALDSAVIELPCLSRSQYANQHSFNCAAEALGCAKGAIESVSLKVKS